MTTKMPKNTGAIYSDRIPDDERISGGVIIMRRDDGSRHAVFVSSPNTGDNLPALEVQETIGRMAAAAWDLANIPTTEESN